MSTSITITVNKFEDFIKYEQWLFTLEFPEEIEINLYCMENQYTEYYNTVKQGRAYIVATKG